MRKLTLDGIRRSARKQMKEDLESMVERWAFLMKIEYDGYVAAPALAYRYYDEAKYCWYHGNFVAAILLSQMALEEQLRNHFHVLPKNQLDPAVNLKRAGFAELADYALRTRYITRQHWQLMKELREKYRNPYVHSNRRKVKVRITNDDGGFVEKELPQQMVLEWKMKHSSILETNVEDDAREAIRILCQVFISICLRWRGF